MLVLDGSGVEVGVNCSMQRVISRRDRIDEKLVCYRRSSRSFRGWVSTAVQWCRVVFYQCLVLVLC